MCLQTWAINKKLKTKVQSYLKYEKIESEMEKSIRDYHKTKNWIKIFANRLNEPKSAQTCTTTRAKFAIKAKAVGWPHAIKKSKS